MKFTVISSLVLLISSISLAKPVAPSQPETLFADLYQQDVDHFNQQPGKKFAQRYWIDSEYASSTADAPVLYHICGEGDVEQSYFLSDSAVQWAKALGAHWWGRSLLLRR